MLIFFWNLSLKSITGKTCHFNLSLKNLSLKPVKIHRRHLESEPLKLLIKSGSPRSMTMDLGSTVDPMWCLSGFSTPTLACDTLVFYPNACWLNGETMGFSMICCCKNPLWKSVKNLLMFAGSPMFPIVFSYFSWWRQRFATCFKRCAKARSVGCPAAQWAGWSLAADSPQGRGCSHSPFASHPPALPAGLGLGALKLKNREKKDCLK